MLYSFILSHQWLYQNIHIFKIINVFRYLMNVFKQVVVLYTHGYFLSIIRVFFLFRLYQSILDTAYYPIISLMFLQLFSGET